MARRPILANYIAFAMFAFPLGVAVAGDVVVIAHIELTLTPDEIKDAFLGEKQIAGVTRVVPLDNGSMQKDFLEKVIKLDVAKYGAVWIKKGFREGLNSPAVKGSDAEVIAVVRSTPGAIGYVASVPAGVKVIQKF